MPRISTIDKKSKAPVEVYVHHRGSNTRIQLDATDDHRDNRGRLIERGANVYAQFEKGQFATNKPKLRKLLEDSISYGKELIEKMSIIQQRATDKVVAEALALADSDPEVAKRIRSELTKKSMAEQKEARAAARGKVIVQDKE